MTVNELIKKLMELTPEQKNMPVYFDCMSDHYCYDIYSIKLGQIREQQRDRDTDVVSDVFLSGY